MPYVRILQEQDKKVSSPVTISAYLKQFPKHHNVCDTIKTNHFLIGTLVQHLNFYKCFSAIHIILKISLQSPWSKIEGIFLVLKK